MENFSYSSYPESGESSPISREIDSENQSWDDPPSTNATANNNGNYRVKFLCSYGGKIQPRSHDNQLAYVGGDTKILAVDRNIKFSAMIAKLSSLCGGDSEVQNIDGVSPPASAVPVANPDFLFGLDKVNLPGSVPAPGTAVVQEVVAKDVTAGSECGPEDRNVAPDQLSPAEIQRQIQELQRMHIAATQDLGILQRKMDESNPRTGSTQDHCKIPDKIATSPAPGSGTTPMPMPTPYFPEQHVTTAGYPATAMALAQGTDQPVYLIPAAGVYQQPPTLRQVTGPAGQPYYGLQRVVQDVYREQPVFNAVPTSVMLPKGGVPESRYVQVAYDGTGRQVYYTVTPCQAMAPAATVGGVAALNQDGKVAVNAKAPPQTS
ncbi:hypothetical protein J1N35_029872 [Gossypium stocksii]|uniref:Uncharacterized protein n=1 Tax=Gossypium stocksii TaxID=47602 RepID=A0A9D3ZTV7_9ROSI|nr:hypothetical protein J1N35_029872 [Gossypium stocksii]